MVVTLSGGTHGVLRLSTWGRKHGFCERTYSVAASYVWLGAGLIKFCLLPFDLSRRKGIVGLPAIGIAPACPLYVVPSDYVYVSHSGLRG